MRGPFRRERRPADAYVTPADAESQDVPTGGRRPRWVRLAWRLGLVLVVLVVAVVIESTSDRGPTALAAQSFRVTLQPDQRDPSAGDGNRYAYGWVKSARSSPERPQWRGEGLLDLADYPDTFVMIERKRFDQGAVGRTTNFHLTGGDEVHNGVSPLSADYQSSPSPDWPRNLRPGLVLTSEASLVERRRGHWQLLTEQEIARDRGAVWTFVWRIHWATGGRGAVAVSMLRNGTHFRTVSVRRMSTIYADQQPRLYVWLGGYVSSGVSDPRTISQSLEQRGRTLEEALADRPRLGSIIHSTSASGGVSSSVARAERFPTLAVGIVRDALR